MRQRMENTLQFNVDGIDLTGATNLEFYIKQRSGEFYQYTPSITSSSTIEVYIPFEDAMKLSVGTAECQLALTTAKGTKTATKVGNIRVSELLKESGYNG